MTNKSAQLPIQVALEIALAIGNSLDLATMTREALRTYLRKLNCHTGMIIRSPLGADPLVVAESPRRALRHPAAARALEMLRARGEDASASVLSGECEGSHFYVMPLTDYGHLMLCRSAGEFGPAVLASLNKLNAKLSGACVACEQNADLARAKQSAEDADTAKTLFLANMSHEIRTPMNGVLGLANLLLLSDLPPREHGFVQTICSSAESLLTIIDDVLHFSTLEHGQFSLHPEPTSLRAVMESVVDILQPVAQEKDLPLHLTIAGDVPAGVIVDPSRLRQILTNLITNAIKFTERGQIDVILQCPQRGTNTVRLELLVIDTGIGISDEQAARLFDPFHQVHGGYDRSRGGVGLGLAITRELASMMGGDVSVNSSLGEGSEFRVTLEVEPCAAPSEDEIATGAYANLAGMRILVAEDDETNQLVVGEMLRLLGAQYRAVGDGLEAAEAAATERFDVILMDVQMPRVDGLAATRAIRAQGTPWAKEVPIIALTAHVMEEHRDQCLEAGMTGFLSKPISPAGLSRALVQHLPRGSVADHPQLDVPTSVDPERGARAERFDVSALAAMLGNNHELLERVLDTFRDEAPKVFADLTEALEEQDYDKAARLAHRLKGTTANMTANGASKLFARLEAALSAQDLVAAEALVARAPVALDEILLADRSG
ncbi:MAG: ATP-binding protein [Halieaceae bacterium]|jgi:signal transduction histidine kinase/CheY-like chemotaxis protein/HPt (histidine-containing phosphotransfer) domain-containing protein|nr:ATP-binding protein [Halieaceae bacterium]